MRNESWVLRGFGGTVGGTVVEQFPTLAWRWIGHMFAWTPFELPVRMYINACVAVSQHTDTHINTIHGNSAGGEYWMYESLGVSSTPAFEGGQALTIVFPPNTFSASLCVQSFHCVQHLPSTASNCTSCTNCCGTVPTVPTGATVVVEWRVNVPPSLLFSWKSGRANKERGSHCICNRCSGFYWFALKVPLVIPTFLSMVMTMLVTMTVRMPMAKKGELLLRVIPGERAATRLETTLRSQARGPGLMIPFWWRLTILGPNWEGPPFKGLWRPKVSMVVTTVSHCFWTILEGARFYDDGERLGGGLPRGCTWRARSSQGRTSPPRGCSQGCSLPGTGSPQEPFPGGSPCLYLDQAVNFMNAMRWCWTKVLKRWQERKTLAGGVQGWDSGRAWTSKLTLSCSSLGGRET